jgi:type VI secretion system protein ImpG
MIEDIYREELRGLHEAGRTFAAAHPDAARWLAGPGADPDVERLLEGVAYLAARIRARTAAIDDEVAQGLCAAMLPTALRPLPAMTVVQFTAQRGLRDPESVRIGTALESSPIDGEVCRFRLAWDVQVPALTINGIELHAGEHPRLEILLALPEGAVPARIGPVLRVHAHAEPALARALIQALASPRSLQAISAAGRIVPLQSAWIGPGIAPLVLPDDPGLARGHAMLAEALAWPELSRFVDISGPAGFGVQPGERGLRIVAELDRLPAALRGVGPDDLRFGCAPAINLWPAEAEPVLVDGSRREVLVRVAGHPAAAAWSVCQVRGSGPGRAPRDWLHARAATTGPCWQELHSRDPAEAGLQLALGRPDAEAEREVLSIDVLAHDAGRAARLGAGDLHVPTIAVPGSLAFRNLLPPARPLLAPHGSQRLHAIAARLRLAAAGVRDVEGLARMLDLHDRRAEAEAAGRTASPRVSTALRGFTLEHRAVPWGSAVARALVHRVDIDEAVLGGTAAAWLLGNTLEQTFAALAPLGTVTALALHLTGSGETLAWPPRCVGAEA